MFSYLLSNIFQVTTYTNTILIQIKNFLSDFFFFKWMIAELKSIEKYSLDHVNHENAEWDKGEILESSILQANYVMSFVYVF